MKYNEDDNKSVVGGKIMDYKIDDKNLDVSMFISFVNQVWQGNYDVEQTRMALSKTLNITAYDNKKLVGCLRILSDGYYFGTITELLVLPQYQNRGLEANFFNLQKIIHLQCYISALNQKQKNFMKRMVVKKSLQSYMINRKE